MNYKSGDLVKTTGNCNGHRFEIGETVRLKRRIDSLWAAEYLDGRDFWNIRESDMTPVKPATMPQKIIVTTDGKTTLARLFDGKTMVKRAEAKCSPSDTFDFGVGAELAVKRLMGEKPVAERPVVEPAKESEPIKLYCIKGKAGYLTKGKVYETDKRHFLFDNGFNFPIFSWETEHFSGADYLKDHLVPLVRRPAKVGEWIYPLEDCPFGRYKKGELLKCTIDDKNVTDVWRRKAVEYNNSLCVIKHGEYLVLDGYTGDPA